MLAVEVLEAGGELGRGSGATSSKEQDRALRERAADAVAAEFRSLATKASDAETDPQRRTVDRLRRELRSIRGRPTTSVPR